MIDAVGPTFVRSDRKRSYRLVHRHAEQFANRSSDLHAQLCSMFAITYQLAGGSHSFIDKTRQPLGASVLTVLGYGQEDVGGGRSKPTMPLRGYSAQLAGGRLIRFGGERSLCYSYDGLLRPHRGARGPAIDPNRDPATLELLQAMDRQCLRSASRLGPNEVRPLLPQILLGFEPGNLPTFEDSPALRRLAAKRLRISVARLGTNGPELLKRLLQGVWAESMIGADAMSNSTGLTLVDAELCSDTRRAVRIFEDHSKLLGVTLRNPSRDVQPLQLPNPSRQVLEQFRIDQKTGFEQPLSDETVQQLELAMRHSVGPASEALTREEVFDGLTCPEQPLSAWTAALPRLRAKIGKFWSETCTDNDVLKAAKRPESPLVASGACQIQVLRIRPELGRRTFVFTPNDLNRQIHLDLG